MANRMIQVYFCCPGIAKGCASGSTRFKDWFEFADWLKQETLKGPVLIAYWEYV